MIQLLDCTLRDGGYINEWKFGEDCICNIVQQLTNAGIDYVEIGFLQSSPRQEGSTLFRSVSEFAPYIPADRNQTAYYGMITYGKHELDDIPEYDGSSLDGLRIIFKKNQRREALQYCRAVKAKGYKIFINPTHTYTYTDSEILELLEEVNDIHPEGFSIVDTMGVMNAPQLVHTFTLIDNSLLPDIKLCYHSHNNLQQAYANATTIINCHTDRDVVIDVSVMGMGRGAGNLCAELMISHLNEHLDAHYNLMSVLKIADEHINRIFARSPWGFSMPYFLAASLKCHPNYATYLADKHTLSIEAINSILLHIPEEKKLSYDIELIKKLYLEYQDHAVDDSAELEKLRRAIGGRNVLILAPGPSLRDKQPDIAAFIATHKPYVFSLNFTPERYAVDTVFFSNAKRYTEHHNAGNVLITSNIRVEGVPTLNYSSYLNNSDMHDCTALMLFVVLMNIGIKEVWLAGLDGFSANAPNYVNAELGGKPRFMPFDRRNSIMREMFDIYANQMSFHFITPSLYEKQA